MNGSVRDSMEAPLEQLVLFAPRIAAAAIVLIVAVVAGRVLGALVVRALSRTGLTNTHSLFFRNLSVWFCVFLGAVIALNVLGLETALTGLLAGSGVAAIIAGFAFREIGENLLAGLFLAFSRPFNVGDYILSEGLDGEVRDIELRYTHIRTIDGRDIYIPNAQIFNRPLTNYTRDGLRRPSFTVGIDYGDDTGQARALLLETIRKVPGVLDEPAPVVGVATLAPQFVELEASFWINSFRLGAERSPSRIEQEETLGQIRSRAMEACRRALLDAGFTTSAGVATRIELDRAPVPHQPEAGQSFSRE